SALEGSSAECRSPKGRHRPARLRPARSAHRVQEGVIRDLPGDDGADPGPRGEVPLEDGGGGGTRGRSPGGRATRAARHASTETKGPPNGLLRLRQLVRPRPGATQGAKDRP